MEATEDESKSVREFQVKGNSINITEIEEKLDGGNIQEAESALREGLSINPEEARLLIGKLEYQRGNIENALRVIDGIDLQAGLQRLQPSISEKPSAKKGRASTESLPSVSQQAASVVLEAIYIKVKSLQKLGKLKEAVNECKSVVDAVEKTFSQDIPDVQVDNKLQDIISRAVELLPELWIQAGNPNEALSAYRRALLSQWNLDNDCCARIQKGLAAFLLYSGMEASPPSLAVEVEGIYVPKNNLEEAILLLMIVVRKFCLDKTKWDPSVMEHLTFALSICGQTSVLAKQHEELMPGIYHRIDRWNSLALCLYGAGQNISALNLLRKCLHKHERPDDLTSLLLAARICSEDPHLAAEGVGYAQRAVSNAQGIDEHLKGVSLRMLGLCLGKQAKVASSDFQRSNLQSNALKSMQEAIGLEQNNSDLIFELAVQYAEQRNLTAAMRYAKQFFDETGGSILKGWRLLALVLSAQQRFSEAEVVINAAIDETAKWEQGPLLRLKAKLKISQSQPMDAIETYRYLLALIQAQRNSFGPLRTTSQVEDDNVNEFDVWHGLASLYASLSYWKDAEICLQKARELKEYSAAIMHTEGCESCGVQPHVTERKISKREVKKLMKIGTEFDAVNGHRLFTEGKFLPTNRQELQRTSQVSEKIRSVREKNRLMSKERGLTLEAVSATSNSLLFEPFYIPGKILLGILMLGFGRKHSPVARSLLSDALRIDPTNRLAWYYLGMVHKGDGRIGDAVDCFQAASMLEESDPIESFSTIL